jgi:hypothetical protein
MLLFEGTIRSTISVRLRRILLIMGGRLSPPLLSVLRPQQQSEILAIATGTGRHLAPAA